MADEDIKPAEETEEEDDTEGHEQAANTSERDARRSTSEQAAAKRDEDDVEGHELTS